MLMMKRKPADPWIPETQEDINRITNRVIGMLVNRYANVSRSFIRGDIEDSIFNAGYEKYMEIVAAGDREIDEHERFLTLVCFNVGQRILREKATRENKQLDSAAFGSADPESGEETVLEPEELISFDTPVAKVLSGERRDAILIAVSKMTPPQRDAFVRAIVNRQSHVEAAKECGVRVNNFEKRLNGARRIVAWGVAKTCRDQLCGEFNDLVAPQATAGEEYSRADLDQMMNHISGCQTCRDAIYDTPFSMDLGVILMTTAFSAHSGPGIVERIATSPVIDGPSHLVRSLTGRTPSGSGSHATEAAVGATGVGAAGGGAALLSGGGGMIAAACAGTAATVCVAGIAAGVIPLSKAGHERHNSDQAPAAIERVVAPPTANASPAPDPIATVQTAYRKQQTREARKQAVAKKQEQAAARKAASTSGSGSGSSGSAPTPAAAQVQTNQSSADTSFSYGGDSASSSSGGSTTTAPAPAPAPAPSTSTSSKAASDSFGFGG